MLRIRDEQLQVIRAAVLHSFKSKMVEHLRDLRVEPSHPQSRDQIISLVEAGMVRAREYGFRMEGPVRLYLELMFTFGEHFDRDPRLPWATEILHCRGDMSELDRADFLYREAENHLTKDLLYGTR